MQLLLICIYIYIYIFIEKLAYLHIVERNYATFAWEIYFQIRDSDSWKQQKPSRLTSFFFIFLQLGRNVLNNMG